MARSGHLLIGFENDQRVVKSSMVRQLAGTQGNPVDMSTIVMRATFLRGAPLVASATMAEIQGNPWSRHGPGPDRVKVLERAYVNTNLIHNPSIAPNLMSSMVALASLLDQVSACNILYPRNLDPYAKITTYISDTFAQLSPERVKALPLKAQQLGRIIATINPKIIRLQASSELWALNETSIMYFYRTAAEFFRQNSIWFCDANGVYYEAGLDFELPIAHDTNIVRLLRRYGQTKQINRFVAR